MDISEPNNYVRLARVIEQQQWTIGTDVCASVIDDPTTTRAMQTLFGLGYVAEPHTALAHHALDDNLASADCGVFLGTAHPAKFFERVHSACDYETPLPPILAEAAKQPVLSTTIGSDFVEFQRELLGA